MENEEEEDKGMVVGHLDEKSIMDEARDQLQRKANLVRIEDTRYISMKLTVYSQMV